MFGETDFFRAESFFSFISPAVFCPQNTQQVNSLQTTKIHTIFHDVNLFKADP